MPMINPIDKIHKVKMSIKNNSTKEEHIKPEEKTGSNVFDNMLKTSMKKYE